MRKKRIVFLIILSSLLLVPFSQQACTEGLADSKATVDGRPIHWKVRMWYGMNRLIFWDNDKNNDGIPDADNDGDGIPDLYPFIGVRSNTNVHPNYQNCMMGLNSAGFSISFTVVYSVHKGNTDPVMMHPLGNFYNDSEFYEFLKTYPGIYDEEDETWELGNTYGVMDRNGNCAEYEYERESEGKGFVRKYDTQNKGRKTIKTDNGIFDMKNIVARANYFHHPEKNGELTNKPDLNYGRYLLAAKKMSLLKANNSLSILTLLQGKSPKKQDFTNATLRRNPISANYINCSTMLIHGVKSDEDPRLTTMWTLLGPSDFSIALPVWVHGIIYDSNKLPPHNLETETKEENIAYYTRRLMQNYEVDEYQELQKYTLPFEMHLLQAVTEILLPEWRNRDWNNKAEVEKIGKEMNRVQNQMSKDAFTFIKYIYSEKAQDWKSAPKVTIGLFDIKKELTANFQLLTQFSDIQTIEWNYGDGTTGTNSVHTYSEKGKYLVSCNIIDFENNSQTAWYFVEIK